MMKDVFKITGNKTLIFRKEGDRYLTFDPIAFEFVELNLMGGRIMRSISQDVDFEGIVDMLAQEFPIPRSKVEDDVLRFVQNTPLIEILSDTFTRLGFPVSSSTGDDGIEKQ